MLICAPERLIKAQARSDILYYNHTYNRYVRDTMCSACGSNIGEQVRYPIFKEEFHYEAVEKNSYKFCPYCGEKL